MSIYRKEYNKANQAHAETAGGQVHVYDGWAIFKRHEDTDGVHDDLIAVVDTETLADTVVVALNVTLKPTESHKVWFLVSEESTTTFAEHKIINTDDLHEYEYPTNAEMNAFLEGFAAGEGWMGFEQFDHDPTKDEGVTFATGEELSKLLAEKNGDDEGETEDNLGTDTEGDEICDECGAKLPEDADSMVGIWHISNCSLHTNNHVR